MNGCVPNWDMDDDYRSFHGLLPTAHSKKSSRIDQELMELVWQNGHVIMQNQTNRKTSGSIGEPKQTNKHEVPTKCGAGLSSLTDGYQEDEHASWLQYSLENSLDKDLYSELFSGMPVTDSAAFEKLEKDTMGNDKYIKSRVADETNIWTEPVPKLSNRLHISQNLMPPPKLQTTDICTPQAGISETAGFVNFSHFARSTKFDSATTHCNLDEKDLEVQKQSADSSSNATKASGNCGSNLILNRPGLVRTVSNGISDAISKQVNDVQKNMREKGQVETHETATITSSSAGSGSSVGKTGPQSISNQIHKRKGREAEDSECQSEGTEYQSIEDGRTLQRKSARRSRAAEVHNLSERRRRDRINEKMRALQELIPHCNKTDKASMLDEAIEYLKSLQLQVQMMWMGNGMAPMMFPTAQHYLSLMGRGIESSIPSAVQMPRVSLVNPSIPSAATVSPTTAAAQNFTANSYPSPLQNANVADIYARYLGFQQMQPPQGVNLFASYGSQMVDSNQATLISDNIKQQNGGPSPQSGKTG